MSASPRDIAPDGEHDEAELPLLGQDTVLAYQEPIESSWLSRNVGILPFTRPPKHADGFDDAALEKDLVRRLDMFLMTFGCISQVIKYLDQQNITNAYVSGMKEDLDLYGDELNYFTTYFNIAYCLMLLPSQIILTYVRPSIWLPGLELAWGVMTGLIATARSAQQIYVLRFFLGLCESSAWPGMMTLLMHWYTPSELAKRMGFYHSCQAVGSMVSGALQVAITKTLDGHAGLAGWRWLFIINSLMTITWGFAGFILLPDLPNRPNPRAFWFHQPHARMALARLTRHGRAAPARITPAAIRRTLTSWLPYYIATLYIASVLAGSGYQYFNLFLKSLTEPDGRPTWSVAQVNAIPIAGNALNVVFVWAWAWVSDYSRCRWVWIVVQALIGLLPSTLLTLWTSHPSTTPLSLAYTGYVLSYVPLGIAPLVFAWLAELLPADAEARALTVGATVAGYYALAAGAQVVLWPASEAPRWRRGWAVGGVLWVVVGGMAAGLRWWEGRKGGNGVVRGQAEGLVAEVFQGLDGVEVDGEDEAVERDSDTDADIGGGK